MNSVFTPPICRSFRWSRCDNVQAMRSFPTRCRELMSKSLTSKVESADICSTSKPSCEGNSALRDDLVDLVSNKELMVLDIIFPLSHHSSTSPDEIRVNIPTRQRFSTIWIVEYNNFVHESLSVESGLDNKPSPKN